MNHPVERIYAAMNEDRLEDLDALFAPGYVDHDEGYTGVDALKAQLKTFRAAFPDLHITIEDTVEQGDRVATRTEVTGIHTGELMGLPPTGRAIRVSAVDISRFESGRAVERWGGLNTYSLMVQL